jgi:hypothetical protein
MKRKVLLYQLTGGTSFEETDSGNGSDLRTRSVGGWRCLEKTVAAKNAKTLPPQLVALASPPQLYNAAVMTSG